MIPRFMFTSITKLSPRVTRITWFRDDQYCRLGRSRHEVTLEGDNLTRYESNGIPATPYQLRQNEHLIRQALHAARAEGITHEVAYVQD